MTYDKAEWHDRLTAAARSLTDEQLVEAVEHAAGSLAFFGRNNSNSDLVAWGFEITELLRRRERGETE